jgi:hypothetical protein
LGRPQRRPPNLAAAIDRDASARSSFSNDGAIEPRRRQCRTLHGMRGRTDRRDAGIGSAMKSAMKLLARHMIAFGSADVAG